MTILSKLMAAMAGTLLFVQLSVPSVISIARAQEPRVRARALGVAPGVFEPGQKNAITDVAGVLVGQATVIRSDSVHTGITAILPHSGNMFFDRVPAAVFVGNAFGKLVGATQVKELGELETPILLTCTLCVWRAADALTDELLRMPGLEHVRSTEEAIYNSMFMATAVTERGRTVDPLPLDRVREILRKYNVAHR